MCNQFDASLIGYRDFVADEWFSEMSETSVPDTEVTVGGVRMTLLPPGDVDAHMVTTEVLIDINLAPAPTRLALNSDKSVEFVAPTESFGFFNIGSELKISSSNADPVLLISLPKPQLQRWLGEDNTMSGFQSDNPYTEDAQMAALGRVAKQVMQGGAFGSRRSDALMAEALLTGISARVIAASQPNRLSVEEVELNWHLRQDKKRLATAIQYAMDNLHDQNLKIADMATQVGWSAPHFAEVFKRAKGMGPYAFILSQRLKLARTMVLATHLPLIEIAFKCGFASQSHMTTSFKKHFNTTPAKMRK